LPRLLLLLSRYSACIPQHVPSTHQHSNKTTAATPPACRGCSYCCPAAPLAQRNMYNRSIYNMTYALLPPADLLAEAAVAAL
jgi:hypothetical protein